MSNDELSNDELRQYIADTVGSMAAVPRRRVLVAVDVIIRRHDNALARAEAAEALAYERLEDALSAEQRATDAELRAEEELEAQRESGDETNGFIDSLIAALDHPIRGDEVFLSEIVETATALKARVAELEAALVSRSELDSGPFNTLVRTIANRNWLSARVAELESQLAAQQWRPIDEPAPKGEIEVKMRCGVADDGGVYKIRTDIFVGWWTSADDSEWRPLPPAPDTQEPTL